MVDTKYISAATSRIAVPICANCVGGIDVLDIAIAATQAIASTIEYAINKAISATPPTTSSPPITQLRYSHKLVGGVNFDMASSAIR
jgi:hypothetical protein